ncbi:MAG: hypothetical protein M3525_12335 [Acidobacteriota bacterium]|nr:hypothetical protein [Acidobacteriota bacterium]
MKRKLPLNCFFTLMLFLCSFGFAFAQSNLQTETKVIGGIATLYALDPLAHSFCFADGGEGSIFQQNEKRNRCSDIDFNNYNEGGLTVGIEGGRSGVIIDLGTAEELQKRYGYTETVGKGQGFASLRIENRKIIILKNRQTRNEPRTQQDLTESELLFAESKKSSYAPVKLGHIYLMRLTDRDDKNFERIVKLIVIESLPNEKVTLRWQVL